MKKLVLSIIGAIVFAAITLFSAFSFPLVGNLDYNQSLFYDTIDSLNNGSSAIFEIESDNKVFNSWDSYVNVINKDLNSYANPVRISKSPLSFYSSDGKTVDLKLSDLTAVNDDASSNYSLLNLDKNRISYGEDSIILRNTVAESLNLSIGDHLFFTDKDNNNYEFVLTATYSVSVSQYNTFYYEAGETTSFVSNKLFNELVDSYKAYLIVKKTDKNYKNTYWNEITPLLHDNDARLNINEKLTINDFLVKGQTITKYKENLQTALQTSQSDPKLILIKVLLVICFISGLISTPTLFFDIYSFEKFRKIRHYLVFALFVVLAGIGVIISYFSTSILALTNIFNQYHYSFVLSLQFLTVSTFVLFLITFLSALIKTYYLDFAIQYENSPKEKVAIKKQTTKKAVYKEEKTITKKQKVLMFGSFVSPDGSAGAIRVLNYAKCLASKKVSTYIASLANDKMDPKHIYEYSKNIYLFPYAKAPQKKIQKAHLYLNPRREVKTILNRFNNDLPEAILIYSVFPLPAIRLIRRFCKKHNIKLIFDVVESHSLSTQTPSSFFATYLQNKIQNNLVIKKKDNVICISSYLRQKMEKRGCNVLTVPFINDVKNIDFIKKPDPVKNKKYAERLHVLYVGNPTHGKDLLAPIINAISSREKKDISLWVAGINVKGMIQNEKIQRQILLDTSDSVTFLGKIDHDSIEDLYKMCDFTILVRDPDKESSKAGFPTKISESLAHGVPVITNLTSDLGDYLTIKNSIILKDIDEKSINIAFDKALKAPLQMREFARNKALNKLDLKSYEDELLDFVCKTSK